MIDRQNRAGRFNQRIQIEEQVLAPDTCGQEMYGPQASQGSWTLAYECWAHIEDTYGIEQKQSGKEVNEEWKVFQILYAPSLRTLIKPDQRITHKLYGTHYDIRSLGFDIDGEKKIIEMTCVMVR